MNSKIFKWYYLIAGVLFLITGAYHNIASYNPNAKVFTCLPDNIKSAFSFLNLTFGNTILLSGALFIIISIYTYANKFRVLIILVIGIFFSAQTLTSFLLFSTFSIPCKTMLTFSVISLIPILFLKLKNLIIGNKS